MIFKFHFIIQPPRKEVKSLFVEEIGLITLSCNHLPMVAFLIFFWIVQFSLIELKQVKILYTNVVCDITGRPRVEALPRVEKKKFSVYLRIF